MPTHPALPPRPDPAPVYQIRIKGHLDAEWAGWFDGMRISRADNGETLLTGPVVDQAALHGLFKKIRDLGLPLVAVVQIPSDRSEKGEQ